MRWTFSLTVVPVIVLSLFTMVGAQQTCRALPRKRSRIKSMPSLKPTAPSTPFMSSSASKSRAEPEQRRISARRRRPCRYQLSSSQKRAT